MSEQYTINSLLSMEKILRSRVSQLNELKNASTHRTIWTEQHKTDEPLYDVKKVDKKIVQINRALFRIDQKIKESNAFTKVDVNIDFDELTAEIE